MSCDLTLGRVEPCKDSVGGLKNIYFVNYQDLTDVTYDLTNTDVVDTVTGAVTINAHKYELKGVNSFEQTINASRDNGSVFFEQVLTVVFKKQDFATHKEIKMLTYGRPKVIVEDYNGNFFLAGLQNGMDVTGGTISTGAAMGDLNGYSLTLTGHEKVPANFMNATDEAGLVTAGLTIVA